MKHVFPSLLCCLVTHIIEEGFFYAKKSPGKFSHTIYYRAIKESKGSFFILSKDMFFML
jgi:hypothetical protein